MYFSKTMGLESNQDAKPHIIKSKEELRVISKDRKINNLTGMRPSGRLHLGHYKGALENWLSLQDEPNINNNFLIADYQVLGDYLGKTELLRQSVRDMIIDRLSIGLDPDKTNFVVQSYVPEFAELFNLLTMFTSYHDVVKNPTLKSEIERLQKRESDDDKFLSMGFINYPVSQIADIMLPRGEIVPVGEDQIPHIELARKVIKKVNTMYDTDFPLPIALLSDTPRLVGTDGNEKMSKSLSNTIDLTASYKEIKKGVHSMYTDPGKISIMSPGNIDKHVVFKYLDIFYSDKNHLDDLKKRYIEGGKYSVGDDELKKLLVQTMEDLIAPIREKREYFENHDEIVLSAIEKGTQEVQNTGQELLNELKEKMGIMHYGASSNGS